MERTDKRIIATAILALVISAISFVLSSVVYFSDRHTKVYNIHRLEVKDNAKPKDKPVKVEQA